jgi:predicted GNAT family N-acyltransferase
VQRSERGIVVANYRKAKAEEVASLVELADRIFRKPGQTSMRTAYSFLLSEDNIEHLLIAEEDSHPVSLVATLPGVIAVEGCTLSVASMGSVCTDPAHRGNNHADTLVQMAIRQCEAEGIYLLLVSGDRGLYRRNQCVEVGMVRSYRLLPHHLAAEAAEAARIVSGEHMNIVVDRYVESRDLAGMLKVMQAERVYYLRTEGQFRQLIANGAYLSNYPLPQHIAVVREGGELIAYAVFGLDDRGEERTAKVIEFGGEDRAVIKLLGELGTMYGVKRASISVGIDKPALAEQLAAAGGELRTGTIPGTIRVIHFAGLWEALRPYMEARIGRELLEQLAVTTPAESGGCRIALGGEACTLDAAGAARLVFDGPTIADDGELKHLLSRIFPIPFVYTDNLNFI